MSESLEQAAKLVDDLLQAAKTGAIIPVRLAGQIEAIQQALEKAKADEKTALDAASKAAAPVDQEAFMKDQAGFFGHAIHELRTPMTSIRGYSDMMVSMGSLNDMQKQFMEVIRTNAKRLEALMQDVADMNKLRAGTLKMTPRMDMFKNIALVTEKQMQPLAEQLKHTMTFEIPSGLPLLNLDGDVLARALNKLVENALRYHEGEDGTVTLKAASDGSTLVITVQDDGIGMTAEELTHMGEVYYRSESELVRSYKGSGLGMAVAFGIVKVLDGTIKVESEHGVGTTVTIRLPGMGG
jgi:signal transduction histidine kinase